MARYPPNLVYVGNNMGKGKTLPVAPGTPGFPWDPFGGLTQPAPANKNPS